ncbi:MAG: AAA family ATPase [Desulfovibrio sp.]|nr:AAA family ATPase [Desulfovibrio sp.]
MSLLNIFIGGESFRELREENCYYVDKTSFLEEMLVTIPPKVSLITRPRRFGKTLMLSMLQEFFTIQNDSSQLFKGLAIAKNLTLCQKWMNQYPVLFITFKELRRSNYTDLKGQLSILLSDLCLEHTYLFESENVDVATKKRLLLLSDGTDNINAFSGAFKLFCQALHAHWSKPVILLIDEYDTPMHAVEQHGYYHEVLELLGNMLSAALKTNTSLKFAVLSGCLPVAQASILTGLNNFKCYGISDVQYSDKFGFTRQEVGQFLQAAALAKQAGAIQEWYDGYLFGDNTKVYCPWDVILYISDLQRDALAQPLAYWKETSENSIVKIFMEQASLATRQKIEALVAGKSIKTKIDDYLSSENIYRNEDTIWTILYHTGYLTKCSRQDTNNLTLLRIPNREVLTIFIEKVEEWFSEAMKKNDLQNLVNALWQADAQLLQRLLTRRLYDSISYFDYSENYYHDFMVGLLRGAGLELSSKAEDGLGRPDLRIEDVKHARAIIIAIKQAKNFDDLPDEAEAGLRQLKEQKYAQGFSSLMKEILAYGIAFWKKEAYVRTEKCVKE